MQNAVLLLLGFVLLIVQASATALINVHPFSPNLLLPVVIYLGVSHEVGLVRGGMLAFVLGYLLDSFTGSPMGLHTFVLVATYMLARSKHRWLFRLAAAVLLIAAVDAAIYVMHTLSGGPVPLLLPVLQRLALFVLLTWMTATAVTLLRQHQP